MFTRQPVGQPPQLGGEEGVGPGDGLGVDVPGEAVVLSGGGCRVRISSSVV